MGALLLSLLASSWLVTAVLSAVATAMMLYFAHNPKTHPKAAHVFWWTVGGTIVSFAAATALFYGSASTWPVVTTAYVLIAIPPAVIYQLLRPLH